MIEQAEEVDKLGPPYLETITNETPETEVHFGKELSLSQQPEVMGLVQSFQDVFQEEPGWTPGIIHKIKTPVEALVREQWHPIPKQLQSAVHAELVKMLAQGIIWPS